VNLDLLRSFVEIAARGSLSQAAERLRVSQSTLTRQMHALEHEIGGPVFDRTSAGVSLTATGHALLGRIRPVLAEFDAAIAGARTLARGQSASLRIGYLMSAAPDYLNPALAVLRRTHPEVKVKLLDLSPGEQIAALRRGEIDLALIGDAGAFLAREFYVRRLATLPVLVALAENHPHAGDASVRLADLRADLFVGAAEADMPGHNRWIAQVCRRAGFRARFVGDSESLMHGLATVVTEGAVSLLPEYAKKIAVPGVVFRPLRKPAPTWDLMVAWQRGRLAAPVRTILDALAPAGRETRAG
jgi:DNA-binding transcriptional LysR family regulator